MFLGNLALRTLLKEGSIYYSGEFDGNDFGLDLHLDRHFWLYRGVPKEKIYVDVRTMHTDELYTYFTSYNVIALPPSSITLATTVETVGSKSPDYAAMLHTRSTLARYGIALDTSSNIFAPGFCSKWTLELINTTLFWQVIPIGAHIGTAYFVRVEDNTYTYNGAYDGKWHPRMMLPKQGNI